MDAVSALSTVIVLIIENFASKLWLPPLLILLFAMVSFPFMPAFKEKDGRKLFVWHLLIPMVTAGGVVQGFISAGAPPDITMLALYIALTATFIMGNMVAFIAKAVPVLIMDPDVRRAARNQPIGMFIILTLTTCIAAQTLSFVSP